MHGHARLMCDATLKQVDATVSRGFKASTHHMAAFLSLVSDARVDASKSAVRQNVAVVNTRPEDERGHGRAIAACICRDKSPRAELTNNVEDNKTVGYSLYVTSPYHDVNPCSE
jgi:hypothetical protein